MTSSTSLPSWVSTLSTASIAADMKAADVNGTVTYAGLEKLLSDLAATLTSSETSLTSAEFSDLETIAENLNNGMTTSPYLTAIMNDLVNGNPANATWTGGAATSTALGNLEVGSSATQLSELIDKWFLGTDLPSSKVVMYGYPTFSVSYSAVSNPLFASTGPSMNDVNQGYLGDCYLLASLAEVAEQNPTLITSMFTSNGNNTYGVRFYVDGVAEYVTVNNSLADGGTIFNYGTDIWASLAEKAYAQLQAGGVVTGNSVNFGNSWSTIGNGGAIECALEEITGASAITDFCADGGSWTTVVYNSSLVVTSYSTGASTASVLSTLITDLADGDDLVLGSYTNATDSSGKTTLVADHAMSIYGYDSATGMLEIRNPWGTEAGQTWDTTFEVSLATLLADGDTITADNVGTAQTAPVTTARTVFVFGATDYTGSTATSLVINGATFSGRVVNSGTISPNGIVLQSGAFISSGGIVDVGTLAGGISIDSTSEILASGATKTAITVSNAATFAGGINNAGTISAKTGIAIFDSTISGGIVDSGSIVATSKGIIVDSRSEILATATAIDIAGKTFTGGIVNDGIISGATGINIASASGVSIFDGGTIAGSGGTAIEFAGSGNTLTLASGYDIIGKVDGSGSNTLALGGSASGGTFDLSSVGTQYVGFTSFQVSGGTWTLTGHGSGWNIDSGVTAEVTSGATLSGAVVNGGGVLMVESGGTVSATTVSSSATLELLGGSTASGYTLLPGATLAIGSGYTFSGTVSGSSTVDILPGGSASRGTDSGTLVVLSGGVDSGTAVVKGAVVSVASTGVTVGDVLSGGTEIVSRGGTASGTVVASSGELIVLSGGNADRTTILSGGTEVVSAGGVDSGAIISSGGEQLVYGLASGATASSGGVQLVESGGVASGSTITSGSTAVVSSGGVAVNATVNSGGSVIVSAGGVFETASGGTAIISAGASVSNLGAIIASGYASLLEILSGASITGSGTIEVANGVLYIQSGSENVSFTSTGSGGLAITDTNANQTAYSGKVSGFGGLNHSDTTQFIDLVNVRSGASITDTYTSANAGNTSGTLTISSGGMAVARIEFIGTYSAGNFHVTSGSGGTVEITDPAVPNGGSVQSANVALFGNYIAGSFATVAAGNGGSLITGAPQSTSAHIAPAHA